MTTRTILALCAAALLPAAVARADPAPQKVDEIVVTAERRATNVQKTPVAVTALPAARLDRSFITDVSGLNAVVPGLEATKTSGFENIVTIRGVGSGTPENDLTTVPGVSLFVDGVYMVNTITLSQPLFDLDHVEVLRGPQGALYGQSSIGGVISLVSNPPRLDDFSGHVDFSVGTYDLTRERAWLNIPIGETLAVRLAVQRFDHEGFTEDAAIPGFREDDAHNTSTKAAILWQPTSNVSATLTGQWYRADENGQAQKNIDDPEPDPWTIYQDYPSLNELTAQLYHLNLQWDLPWFSVRSVSAYQGMSSVLREDSSRSAVSLIHAYDDVAGWDTRVNSWTEEFDVLSRPGGRLDWIVGAFVLSQRSRQFVAEFEGGDTPNPDTTILPDIETDPPLGLDYGNDSLVKRQSYSGFVQATYHILPSLRLTAGGRMNVDHYSDVSNDFSNIPGVGPGFSTAANEIWDHVPTWRAELDWDATPDNMLYASAARGYKPAGVNGNNTSVVVPFTFQRETNTAFEVGSKNEFLDRSLRVNAAAFYYLYKDMQYIEEDPVPFAGGISNIPNVHIYGVEAEAAYVGLLQSRLLGGGDRLGEEHRGPDAAGHAGRLRPDRGVLSLRCSNRQPDAPRRGGLSRLGMGADFQRAVARPCARLHGDQPRTRLPADTFALRGLAGGDQRLQRRRDQFAVHRPVRHRPDEPAVHPATPGDPHPRLQLLMRPRLAFVALSGLYFLVTAGTFNGLGVVLPAMVSQLAWNWKEAGAGYALLGVACGLTSLAAAGAIRRFGVRAT
ncbi:MAG: TonB-dependent receptor, partial [Caulobacteraceae bacterium]